VMYRVAVKYRSRVSKIRKHVLRATKYKRRVVGRIRQKLMQVATSCLRDGPTD